MKAQKYILSDQFVRELGTAMAGYMEPDKFDALIWAMNAMAEKYFFSHGAEANLHRIIFSQYDKIAFLLESLKYPHYLEIIFSIAVNSNYLTDIIVRNPEYLSWILSPESLTQKITEKSLHSRIEESLSRFRTLQARVNLLRMVKRREILRIGVNDILGNSTLKETTSQLALLAKAINAILFSMCFQEVMNKYGISSKNTKYCLAALGKCGGDELNYSSDVDLILFFDKNSTVGTKTKKEYYEVLTEAAHLFIQNSTAITDKGYIYRVDFRLRPDGRNSPLCRSLKDYLQYYETRGEDWERQMLIKMSFVGGSKKLYDQFSDYIQHFIYPSSFSRSPLSQIAAMKKNIEKNMGDTENVKLFSGGIRDIEFSVQALQLLNGGRLPSIRSGNTLEAIELLTRNELLTSDETAGMTSSYIFYRKIEHFLQLMNDKQTHDLPTDSETLEILSHFMGFKTVTHFRKKIDATRKSIREIFRSITGENEPAEGISFEKFRFRDPKKSINNYKYLRTGQGLLEQKQFDKQTIDSFLRIEDSFAGFLEDSSLPDTVLDSFVRIIKTRPLPSIWYHEFSDRVFFEMFLRLCQNSQKAVDMIMLDRSLGDLLLSRRAFSTTVFDGFSLSQTIFVLTVQFALGIKDYSSLSHVLSQAITVHLIKSCSSFSHPSNYFIAAMGSLGSCEMTFASDVDLIMVAENIEEFPSIESDFQHHLAGIKNSLQPFEVDCRLRPEGKSAQLVWDISRYNEYIDKRMQTWELQALTRVRFMYGNKNLFDSFVQSVHKKIESLPPGKPGADILEMRKKIEKQLLSSPQANFSNYFNIRRSRGALLDIEFIIQYTILKNPGLYYECLGQSTEKNISLLIDFSEKFHSFEALKKNYAFLKDLLLRLQVSFNTASPVVPLDEIKREFISGQMGFRNIKDFDAALLKTIRKNRELFEKFIA